MTDTPSIPEPKDGSRGFGSSSFFPYLVVGFSIWLIATLVLYFGLGELGFLIWPFVWAYSQTAMIERVIGEAGRVYFWAAWSGAYFILSVLLWLSLERWRVGHRGLWLRCLLGWLSAEVMLGVLAWVLYLSGAIQME